MKSRILLAIAAMLVVALPAAARPLHTITENGLEVVASMLRLPSSVGGTVTIQGCTACKAENLTLGADARFYVGKQEVAYAALKDLLESNPKSAVLVVTPVGKNVITRIKLSAISAADVR
jgi:hypothetical protein